MQIDEKQRIVQEFVPGKQITLAHIIANPTDEIYQKLGLVTDDINAIGIMTITPSEGAIIAADVATKASDVRLGFIDRFSGALVITGDVSSVESAIRDVVSVLSGQLLFTPAAITRT
ncbi:MAG: BMC domain-containing protein [Anaerocolumna aminovalerica]|nr:BMC domain-containing protein [Anaerocolumna aminovalerica]MBU5331573.1 BMC domain-containing protein [Anaerocolumna aminovalerica]MDU6265460.1 BMC domain-containing protein [Anaerocolumna aminovalerica]